MFNFKKLSGGFGLKIFCLAVLFSFLFPLTALGLDENAPTATVSPDEYLNQAEASYAKGDYSGVVTQCSSIIAQAPTSTSAYLLRAKAYYKLGNYSSTINDCSEFIKLDDKNAEAYELRGWANYHIYAHKKGANSSYKQYAYDDLSMAVKISNGAYYLTSRADLYICTNKYDEALADCGKAIELQPNYVGAYYRRSMIRYTKGEQEGFMLDIFEILRLNSNDAYANKIVYYMTEGYTFYFKDPEH